MNKLFNFVLADGHQSTIFAVVFCRNIIAWHYRDTAVGCDMVGNLLQSLGDAYAARWQQTEHGN